MIVRLIVSALAVFISAHVLDGVAVEPWWSALIVAVVLGLINAFIKPVIKFLALPVNIVTLGLFTLVINALMVELCSWVVGPHFEVASFWWALAFSIVLTIVNWALYLFVPGEKKE